MVPSLPACRKVESRAGPVSGNSCARRRAPFKTFGFLPLARFGSRARRSNSTPTSYVSKRLSSETTGSCAYGDARTPTSGRVGTVPRSRSGMARLGPSTTLDLATASLPTSQGSLAMRVSSAWVARTASRCSTTTSGGSSKTVSRQHSMARQR